MKPVYIKITKDGNKLYFSDQAMTIRSREDGPAVEYVDGYKEWWLNGKLSREDGPAVEHADGYKQWWLNDKYISEEEHTKRTRQEVVLTIEEIAKKFGIPVEKLRIKQ